MKTNRFENTLKSGESWKCRHNGFVWAVENGAFRKQWRWITSLRRATSFQASRLKFKTNMADEQMDMLLYVIELFSRLFGA